MEIQVGEWNWVFNRFGSGSRLLIAFHGYGQDSSWFRHHEELFGENYTILAVDLAYHGKQEAFLPGFQFNQTYSKEWLKAVCESLGISSVSLMGYSIGARVALSITGWHPEFITELWLLAPDGLPVSTTYRLLTNTGAGKFIFKSFVNSPGFSLNLIRLFQKTGILHPKVADFYRTEIGTKERRKKLFDTWMAYRKAQPDYTVIRKQLDNSKLKLTCVLGKEDRVIPLRKTKSFIINNLQGADIIELELGHNLLSDKGARLLEQQLYL
jgi:pimeloyl-ACP methyl ester carboxylesterase